MTPKRKGLVMSISRENYKAASRKIIHSDNLKKPVISALSREVLNEMKCISSVNNATLLRGSNDELKHFSWEALWQEMQRKMPIFLSFLHQILPKADRKFIVFLVAMMLKRHCKHLSLVQRIVSVMFYGNGCHKQV